MSAKIEDLFKYIENKDVENIKILMKEHDLIIKDGKIIANIKDNAAKLYDFWNRRQQIRKIILNATYGSLLNVGCRFFDQRIGQSVTLTGRMIVKHMNSKVNETLAGEYDYDGVAVQYSDTDSFFWDTIIRTSDGNVNIKNLFERSKMFWNVGDKEYAADDRIRVLTYDPKEQKALFKDFNYIYRHKVSKAKWKVTDELGNEVIITEDHSVMIERNNELIEVKPKDILEDDILISVIDGE